MDKLVRKIEIPLARKAIEKAGLYIVEKKDLDRMAEIAADAYQDYPLHTQQHHMHSGTSYNKSYPYLFFQDQQ